MILKNHFGQARPTKPQQEVELMQEVDYMPNAGEIIERLARENERQRIEIAALKQQLTEKG